MPILPTLQPEGIFFLPRGNPVVPPPFEELRDELGNTWWLVNDEWTLVGGTRYGTCQFAFDGGREQVTVNGILYRSVVFVQSEEVPRRVGFVEVEK